MKQRNNKAILNWAASATICTIISANVVAYEVPTHRQITTTAILRSQLALDSMLMWHLGIGVDPSSLLFFQGVLYASGALSFEKKWRIVDVIGEGVDQEDGGFRAINHFFDPISGGTIDTPFEERPSPDWILEDAEIDSQDWSYQDMMDVMYDAMISTNEDEASQKYATAFKALGHVVHHVQDMAQPQHARVDPHCNSYAFCWGGNYEPSFYEWLSLRMSNGGLRATNGEFIVWPSDPGQYPNVLLYQSRDYWHQDAGFGMAEYSNRNFVTEDTNYRRDEFGNNVTTKFDSPGVTGWEQIFFDGSIFMGHDGEPLSGGIHLVKAPVTDSYLGTGPETTHFTSSFSVFSEDVRDAIDAGVPAERFDERNYFYLNRINLQSANDHLYQRAIGYSAGFIDHIFRGRLEIAPPDDNIYSVIDHAVTNEAPDGFTSIKLKLRNATPQQTSPDSNVATDGHWVKAGKLVAVALFRPNVCYTPDLRGELDEDGAIANGCSVGDWLRTEQHRVVSEEIDVDGLDSDELTDLEFDFSANPIPVNARDLSIQVIFRGAIGGDEDAFAVARKDISEPTWFGGLNSTDYISVDGVFENTEEFLISPEAEDWGINTDEEREPWRP